MTQSSNRMSISREIFLIAASFSIPIAVLVYLMVSNTNSDVRFGELEMRGNAYQRPLVQLLHHLHERKLDLVTCAKSSSACSGLLTAGKSKIDQTFTELNTVQQQYGNDLQFHTEGLAKRDRAHLKVELVKEQWESVASASPTAANLPELHAKLDQLITNVRGMITHAGDTSNLILDPDLDSYYLMDVTLLALPQNMDRMGKMSSLIHQGSQHGGLDASTREELAVQVALLGEADIDRTNASSQTALSEDANFYGVSSTLATQIGSALAKYSDAANRFKNAAKQLASGTPSSEQVSQCLDNAKSARAVALAYWVTAVDELDKLLQNRIDNYKSSRASALAWSGLAVLAASALAFALMRTITLPLGGLVRSLGPGADLLGVCVERISESSKSGQSNQDETTIICEELSAHCQNMRKAVMELVTQVEGATGSNMQGSSVYQGANA